MDINDNANSVIFIITDNDNIKRLANSSYMTQAVHTSLASHSSGNA